MELLKERFHALLCDPPYHLGLTGFMGKHWDKDGPDAVAFNPKTWARLAESLLPGAFGMAFASSRGWHRLACAIEDAGLILHPTIFNWCAGSGFPKATRIDTQIDEAAGMRRDIVGSNPHHRPNHIGANTWRESENRAVARMSSPHITAPASPLSAAWESHRYGLQSMKPAIEPIILFQKPYRGKPLDSIVKTGAGAINIDAGRIGDFSNTTPSGIDRYNAALAEQGYRPNIYQKGPQDVAETTGRWPANFVLDEEAAARLDEQAGELTSGMMTAGTVRSNLTGFTGNMPTEVAQDTYGDSGGPSRFFHTYNWNHEVEERLFETDPVFYSGKAQRGERDAGLSMAKKPMLWSSGTQNPGSFQAEGTDRNARNPHPTLKPISLTNWLAKLLLPPDLYAPRRILVPFAGSGSEAIGAMLAGWEEITMVEMTDEYIPIIEARMKFWHARRHKDIKVSKPQETPPNQIALFA